MREITNTELIARNLDTSKIAVEKIEKTNCFMCNAEIEEGIKYKKAISGNFSNYNYVKNRKGTYICKYCATCIKEADLRKKNFVATKDKIVYMSKNDLENNIFNLREIVGKEAFVVGVTNTFKKHNSFKCKINYNTEYFTVNNEDSSFIIDVEKHKKLYKVLNDAYMQFSKVELETGDYKLISMQQYGVENIERLEEQLQEHRGTKYFEFLIHIMNSEVRNEKLKERIEKEKEEKKQQKIKKEKKESVKKDDQQRDKKSSSDDFEYCMDLLRF